MKSLAIAFHAHENGNDAYLFQYEGTTIPSEEAVAKQLGIDFEPERYEKLSLSSLSSTGSKFLVPSVNDIKARLPEVKE